MTSTMLPKLRRHLVFDDDLDLSMSQHLESTFVAPSGHILMQDQDQLGLGLHGNVNSLKVVYVGLTLMRHIFHNSAATRF